MIRGIFAVAGVLLLVGGVIVAENYRGSARRVAIWAVQTNNRVIRGRGPYRWRHVGFQTVAHRIYGGVFALIGLITLAVVVHH